MNQGFTSDKAPAAMSLALPAATVFMSSFCIMVLEFAAARMIAKQLGSSLYTWTAVIGIVLGGITLGNWIGGRIADRFPVAASLPILFAISAAACIQTIVVDNLAGDWLWLWKLAWPTRVFTHVLLTFMLPSTMLGMISPVVAKMALDRKLPPGRTVGTIYAWGAAGSIIGTFVTGYFLIAAMGPTTIVWIVGALLLLIGVLYSRRPAIYCIWAAIFVSVMAIALAPSPWCKSVGAAIALRQPHDPSIIYRDETPYCAISVQRTSQYPEHRVFIQDKLTHSKIVMGDIDDLQYFYTKIYAAITQGLTVENQELSIMVIGGGGYVFPRYVEKHFPGSSIEVVEIDPGVTRAATLAFGLSSETTIKTRTMDARNYIDRLLQYERTSGRKITYDFIYGDAVNDYSAPYQLLTRQFNEKISDILSDRGVYMLTLIDVYDQGGYLGAVVNTLKQTFPNVYVLTEARMPDWARNTFIVVAARTSLDVDEIVADYPHPLNLRSLNDVGMKYLEDKSNGIVLTDDYAPVENLLAPVVRRSAKGFLAHKYMTDARKFDRLDKSEQAVQAYTKAAQVRPELTIDAFGYIGLLYIRLNNFKDAVEPLEKAIEYNRSTQTNRNLANLHFNLGVALQNLDREDEALEHYRRASRDFGDQVIRHPKSPQLRASFAQSLVRAGDLARAAEEFRTALDLDPDNIDHCIELAKALEFLQRYDEAISTLRNTLERIEPQNRPDDLETLRAYIELVELRKKQAVLIEN